MKQCRHAMSCDRRHCCGAQDSIEAMKLARLAKLGHSPQKAFQDLAKSLSGRKIAENGQKWPQICQNLPHVEVLFVVVVANPRFLK